MPHLDIEATVFVRGQENALLFPATLEINDNSLVASGVIPLKEKLALLGILPRILSQGLGASPENPTSGLKNDHINACAYLRKFSPNFVAYVLEPIMAQYMGFGEDDFSLGWLISSLFQAAPILFDFQNGTEQPILLELKGHKGPVGSRNLDTTRRNPES